MYLIPRVRRIFYSPNWSKLMEYGLRPVKPPAGWIWDVLDGSAYKRIFGSNPGQIPISKYNLAWSFGADGLPISHVDMTYATTPLLFHLCALCPWPRCLWDYLFVVGFTPGPGKNNVAIFLQQVAEEFERAWRLGFYCWDVMTGMWHLVKMVLLFGTFDLRGTAQITDGNQAPALIHCHICDVKGEYLKPYKATYYNADWTHLPDCTLRAQCEARKFPGMPDPPLRISLRNDESAAAACEEAEASRFSLALHILFSFFYPSSSIHFSYVINPLVLALPMSRIL